jgi:signal transduction histidine kinase
LSQARSLARSSLGEVRRSVFGLRDAARSPVLAELIADLTRCLSTNSGIRVEVESAGDRALPDAVTFSLFRIAQESITNALKHSNATRIALRLDCTGSEARLTVCDNGCGFDTSRAPSSGHYGIIGMQERAAQIHAEIRIESRAGFGTEVIAVAKFT